MRPFYKRSWDFTHYSNRFYPSKSNDEIWVTLYLGSTSHRQYAGPDSLEKMAATILSSHGPSGPNIDYLYNLAASMRELVPDEQDLHLEELEAEVRKQEAAARAALQAD